MVEMVLQKCFTTEIEKDQENQMRNSFRMVKGKNYKIIIYFSVPWDFCKLYECTNVHLFAVFAIHNCFWLSEKLVYELYI
jgi:hypothetical protein